MSIKGWLGKKFLQGKLPSFVYRFIGRRLADKIHLEDTMDTKRWYASKTLWTAVVAAILGAIQPISGALGHPIVIPNWVYEILAGFGLYSLRTGDKPIV